MRKTLLILALPAFLAGSRALRAEEAPPPAASAFDIFDQEFLKREGIQILIDRGDMREALHAVAEHFRKRKEPRYFPWADQHPEKPAKPFNTQAADDALAFRFVIRFLHAPVQFPQPMNWKDPAIDGRLLDPLEVGVLNGGMWVDALSEAWWNTRDRKYVEGCLRLLHGWRAQSPPPPLDRGSEIPGRPDYAPAGYPAYPGINIGGRMTHWTNAFYRMRDCAAFTDEEMLFFMGLLEESGQRLEAVTNATADTARRVSNHLTVTYRGLLTLGLFFPELKSASDWKALAIRSIRAQAQEAVSSDGFQWEHCPGYHTNCLRDYLAVQRLAALNGVSLGQDFDAKLESMYDCILKIMYPNKCVPLLNDSDGTIYGPSEMALGACLFKREDFKYVVTMGLDFPAEAVGGVTEEERKAYADLKPRVPDVLSVALRPSGHYIMRTGWDPMDKYLLLTQGKYAGWHSHADQLGIDLYAFGRTILVDPGSCHYADPAHQVLQSCVSHNVVCVDSEGTDVQTSAAITLWTATSGLDAVSGELLYPSGHTWKRTVAFVKPDYWVVADEVWMKDKDTHEIDQLWHYVPGEAKASGNRILFARPPAPQAEGNLLMTWPSSLQVEIQRPKGFLSAGVAGTAKVDANGKAEAEFIALGQKNNHGFLHMETLLYPYRGDHAPEAEIVSERTAGGTGIRVKRKDGEDILLLGNGKEPLKLWGYTFDGDLALLRLDSQGVPQRVSVHGGTLLAGDQLSVSAGKPFPGVSLVMTDGHIAIQPPTEDLKVERR